MFVHRRGIDRDIGTANRRLWSLPAALEHLKSFVADRSGQAGKSAVLEVSCPAILVSQKTINIVVPTLAQLLRNAVEHGVENPVTRLVAGKPLTAVIELDVSLSGNRMLVSVSDDGAGFEPSMAGTVRRGLRDVSERGRNAVDGEARRAALLRHGIAVTGRDERPASGLQRAVARTAGANGEISFFSEPRQGTTFLLAIAAPAVAPEMLAGIEMMPFASSVVRAAH